MPTAGLKPVDYLPLPRCSSIPGTSDRSRANCGMALKSGCPGSGFCSPSHRYFRFLQVILASTLQMSNLHREGFDQESSTSSDPQTLVGPLSGLTVSEISRPTATAQP